MIDSYYIREVETNLGHIEAALREISDNGNFDDKIREIHRFSRQLMDLGMIHGYEGVEAIAERMCAASQYCAWQGPKTLPEVQAKLEQSLRTLREVVDISDARSARELVDKTRHGMDYAIDDLVPAEHEPEAEDADMPALTGDRTGQDAASGSKDSFASDPADTDAADPLFEIREFTALPRSDREPETIADMEQDPAQIFEQKPEPETEPESEPVAVSDEEVGGGSDISEVTDFPVEELQVDYIRAFENGEVQLLSDSLEEEVKQEFETVLDGLGSIVADGRSKEIAAEVISLCKRLQVARDDRAFASVHALLVALDRACRGLALDEKLADSDPEPVLEGIAVLRDFVQERVIPISTVNMTAARLQSLRAALDNSNQNGFYFLPEESDDDDGELPPPPRIPLIVRLKRLFGMY